MPSRLLSHKQVQEKNPVICPIVRSSVYVCSTRQRLGVFSEAHQALCSCPGSSCLSNLKANFLENLSLTADLVMLYN